MKFELVLINRDNTEDKFIFKSIEDLFNFLNELTVEKLMDSNIAEMEYTILVK